MYMHRIAMGREAKRTLPELPCACASIRRAARAVTRIYDEELRPADLELTQFTLLMALDLTGEITQKALAKVLAMDSTTLTRTLRSLTERGWIRVRPGEDRRKKLWSMSAAGRRKFEQACPHWERAQARLRAGIGEARWRELGEVLGEVTAVATVA